MAALVRLCSLGTFSLDLDEVLTMTRAVLPFPEMIAACAQDPDNVPLYLVLTSLSLAAGLAEPWFRLPPIAAGLASIVRSCACWSTAATSGPSRWSGPRRSSPSMRPPNAGRQAATSSCSSSARW
jgi:hypothetical protein